MADVSHPPRYDGPIDVQALTKPRVKDGTLVKMKVSGDQYVVENVHDTPHGQRATLRRAVPKLSKKERKAAKAAKRNLGPGQWLK